MFDDNDIDKLRLIFPTKNEVVTKSDFEELKRDFNKLKTSVDGCIRKVNSFCQKRLGPCRDEKQLENKKKKKIILILIFMGISSFLVYIVHSFFSPSQPSKPICKDVYIKVATTSLIDTNNVFINWSILILAGTFGLVVAGRNHRIRGQNLRFTLLPPAWIFLVASMFYGTYVKFKLSFLLAQENLDPLLLNTELLYQVIFFWLSLIPLLIMICIYLYDQLSTGQ